MIPIVCSFWHPQTSEAALQRKEKGDADTKAKAEEEVIYKIEIPANR